MTSYQIRNVEWAVHAASPIWRPAIHGTSGRDRPRRLLFAIEAETAAFLRDVVLPEIGDDSNDETRIASVRPLGRFAVSL